MIYSYIYIYIYTESIFHKLDKICLNTIEYVGEMVEVFLNLIRGFEFEL